MSGQLGTLGFAVSLAALLLARLWFTTVLCYSGVYSNCHRYHVASNPSPLPFEVLPAS